MTLPKKQKRGSRSSDPSPGQNPIVLRDAKDLERLLPPAALKALRLSDVLGPGQLGKAVWTDWNFESAVEDGYKSNVWCYVCIYRIATSAGSVPWRVETGADDTGWTIAPGHPLAKLINKPNFFESRQQYIERLTLHLMLGGNGVQAKTRADGIPVELWNVRPDVIKPVPVRGRRKQIAHYEVKVDKSVVRKIPTRDIIHQMFVDPFETFWGVSPTEPSGGSIDTDREANDWRKKSLENRAVVSGILSFKHKISQTQFDEARAMLAEQHKGSDNALDAYVIGNDAEWKQLGLSPVEMDFIQGSKLTREEICAAYGVPPAVAGILENATLSNVEASWINYWMNTMVPFLDRIKATWNQFLTPEFGEGIRLQYDLSRVPALQALFRANIDAAERLWKMGIPFQEINRRLEMGLEAYPGWEFGYVNNRTVRINPDGTFTSLDVASGEPQTENSNQDDDAQAQVSSGNGAVV